MFFSRFENKGSSMSRYLIIITLVFSCLNIIGSTQYGILDILAASPENTGNRQQRQVTNEGQCRTRTGEVGVCRPIVYCSTPELSKDVYRLISQLCVINQNEVGVCCTPSMQSQLAPAFVDHSEVKSGGGLQERGCGSVTQTMGQISGGAELAQPHEFPWMAAILRAGWPNVWCGSTLVTERHVMTAGHCVYKLLLTELTVRLGEYNTQLRNETRARDFPIASVMLHVDFNPMTYEHDIALLRLDRSAFFNTYIWPVCMPPTSEEWAGRMALVSGWGSKGFGGQHSNLLLEVRLPVWNLDDCRNALVERIPDTVLCAGSPSGGLDSCQGDSGGPLLYQLPNNRWVVIGIVSWGVRCGEPNRPGVYTRVDRYLDWIIQNSLI